jgi:hypothetical protein
MQQARLTLIADHALHMKEKETIVALCTESDGKSLLQQALNLQSNIVNYKDPDQAEKVVYQGVNNNGDLLFSVNEINIRISKHLIQFYFPFLFRVMVDYIPLRNAYYRFLHHFLTPFHSTRLIEFPSFWEQKSHEVKNEWHERRLKELQYKLVNEGTSFKRSRLNLQLCLGEPTYDIRTIMANKYRVWREIKYDDLLHPSDSNPLLA